MFEFWKYGPVWAPNDDTAAGGGGDDTVAAGGDDTVAGGGGDDTAAGAGGDDKGGRGDPWWQDKRFDEGVQTQLKALGLTVDDPLDAISRLTQMEKSAKQKLGANPNDLIAKPKDGQDVAEWLRSNAETFGIPENAEGYEVKRPDDWPKDMPWSDDMEQQARKIAHEEGLSGKALQRMTDLFADHVKGIHQGADEELARANATMMQDLQKDWGDQANAKMAQAQQAASMLAQAAGLDEAAMGNLAEALKPKIGDANTIRLFAAVHKMAGEDGLVLPGGAPSGAMTPAEARAEIEKMKSPDSDFAKLRRDATEGKRKDEFQKANKRWQELHKIASS
ncbi:hypothetical protein [Roseovarius atlanticus]|uniref:hypothetical protein n=1 Tax=Roseovarius atlanticus TaxID=1641875 RepID=UPI001C96924C|nr:hypothetical protein [Roseovarius atlanticus]MBY5988211.1 hypothetical protein [Roseovarius atlanticus]MBY6123602.1 hypothetical protein [Roseovarius atlanticus]MBY6148097.1 hypothetical protein [Roseovarius atlanticus]